ncbi:general substrate transporter, partial [Syncephalis fuscata]
MYGLLILATLSAAFNGLYIGYDYGVIGGFFAIPASEAYFQWESDTAKGFIASSFVLGGLFSAIVAGSIADTIGRRMSIISTAVISAIGGLLQTIAVNIAMLYVGRFVSGLAVGMAYVVAPLYIAEVAPKQWRGTLVYFIQINLCLGLLVSTIINYGASFIKGNGSFRLILALQMLPPVFIITGMLFSPESPRWLIYKHKTALARRNLARFRNIQLNDPLLDKEIQIIQQSIEADNKPDQAKWHHLVKDGMWRRLLLASAIGSLQQLCGINAITYYSPDILSMSGITESSEQLALTIISGVTNLIGSITGTLLVDRFGRRTILVSGGLIMSSTLFTISILIATGAKEETSHAKAYGILAMMCLFVGAFSFSWGPVTWIYVTEIFPQHARGKAMAVSATLSWACNFIVSQVTPLLFTSLGWGSFLIYGGVCLIGSIWEYIVFPETKQKSFEEINAMFSAKDRQNQ